MPGNGLTFAVRVGCENDFISLLRGTCKLVYDLLFAASDDKVRDKPSFDVDSKASLTSH